MELKQREDFNGRIADRVNLANEKTTGPREMISALSQNNIKEYLKEKNSKKVEINNQSRLDFSDLLEH